MLFWPLTNKIEVWFVIYEWRKSREQCTSKHSNLIPYQLFHEISRRNGFRVVMNSPRAPGNHFPKNSICVVHRSPNGISKLIGLRIVIPDLEQPIHPFCCVLDPSWVALFFWSLLTNRYKQTLFSLDYPYSWGNDCSSADCFNDSNLSLVHFNYFRES